MVDTLTGIAYALAARAAGAPFRVFDWDKAAKILRETGVKNASAGLAEDLEYTECEILKDGKPVAERDGGHLSSLWATPVLIAGDFIECWRYDKDTPGWTAHTFWPDSALAIFHDTTAP